VTVERPLRVRYAITEQAIEAISAAAAVAKLGKQAEPLAEAISDLTGSTLDTLADLEAALAPIWTKVGKVGAPVRKAVIGALTVRDPAAEPVKTKKGFEPDPELRDTENIPLDEDVDVYIEREVRPYAPEPGSTSPRRRSATRSRSLATSTSTCRRVLSPRSTPTSKPANSGFLRSCRR
jgi:type I restriction enzyme M protein